MPLRYCDWARLVSMTSAIWTVWGSIWGIIFRKFFFDMIGAKLGPKGLEPPPSSDLFIAIIVKAPIVQIISIFTGLFILAFEWPLPMLSGSVFHRSNIFKAVFLFFHGFLSLLLYQGFDSAFVAWPAMAIYLKAHAVGHEPESDKQREEQSQA